MEGGLWNGRLNVGQTGVGVGVCRPLGGLGIHHSLRRLSIADLRKVDQTTSIVLCCNIFVHSALVARPVELPEELACAQDQVLGSDFPPEPAEPSTYRGSVNW